jgi:hypothetical protein
VQDLDRTSGHRPQVMLIGAALAAVLTLGAGGVAALSQDGPSLGPAVAAPSPSNAVTKPAAEPMTAPVALVEQTVQAVRVYGADGDAFFQDATLRRQPAQLSVVKNVGERLRPQDASALLIALPLAATDPTCIRSASLALDITTVTGGPAEVGIYPGAATSLVDDRLPASGADDVAAILDNRPRGVAEVTAPGLQTVDVTELARTWSTGGPFPSTGRRIEPGTPLLLVLRPTNAAPGIWTVTLRSPPALTFRSTPACR